LADFVQYGHMQKPTWWMYTFIPKVVCNFIDFIQAKIVKSLNQPKYTRLHQQKLIYPNF